MNLLWTAAHHTSIHGTLSQPHPPCRLLTCKERAASALHHPRFSARLVSGVSRTSATSSAHSKGQSRSQGTVVKVVWANDQNGFGILKVQSSIVQGYPESPPEPDWHDYNSIQRHRDLQEGLIVVKGSGMGLVTEGQAGVFKGEWQWSQRFKGFELAVEDWEEQRPESPAQLQEYLIGGIGRTIALGIKEKWDDSVGTRNGAIFLRKFQCLTPSVRQDILNLRGSATEAVIRRDPYAALQDAGVGFRVAEQVAGDLGLDAHNMDSRGHLALISALKEHTREGHTYAPWELLRITARGLLCTKQASPWESDSRLLEAANQLRASSRMVAEAPIDLAAELERLQHNTRQQPGSEASQRSPLLPDTGPQSASQLFSSKDQQLMVEWYLMHHLELDAPVACGLVEHLGAEGLIEHLNSNDAGLHLQRVKGISTEMADDISSAWAGIDSEPPASLEDLLARATEEWAEGLNTEDEDELLFGLEPTQDAPDDLQPLDWKPSTCCYEPHMYRAEAGVARLLTNLAVQQPAKHVSSSKYAASVQSWIDKTEENNSVERRLSGGQREALVQASKTPLLILTGGPGCGKTVATASIVKLWRADRRELGLAAPTGRAAQKMQESCGSQHVQAKTLHRLLEYQCGHDEEHEVQNADGSVQTVVSKTQGRPGRFARGDGNPLEVDAVLVDETSMVDINLALALLKALPQRASRPTHLVLVGDADQLPPVGPGTFLDAIIQSGIAAMVDLREVFRQAAQSAIITAAHAVLNGNVPTLARDLFHLPQNNIQVDMSQGARAARAADWMTKQAVWLPLRDVRSPTLMRDTLVRALQSLTAGTVDGHPVSISTDVQVLMPVRKGPVGVNEFNRLLQAEFNPSSKSKAELHFGSEKQGNLLRVGDRVMQTVNDYDTEVFNGDMGFVTAVDKDKRTVSVSYPSLFNAAGSEARRQIKYENTTLRDLQLAWATTVHKAQGGESPISVLCLSQQHGRMLNRRLLYTAITRAQKLVVIIGSEAALSKAVREVGAFDRRSQLPQRLRIQGLSKGLQLRTPLRFPPLAQQPPDPLMASLAQQAAASSFQEPLLEGGDEGDLSTPATPQEAARAPQQQTQANGHSRMPAAQRPLPPEAPPFMRRLAAVGKLTSNSR
ncbi:hypothetical protein WJX73_010388 [Symbiochloris irregularis]|uniref:Uncharacterized protein n=1 Tax=Symbiochloris irregularis TaxID=706552 RepID=A0AAW1NU56_9CHLO